MPLRPPETDWADIELSRRTIYLDDLQALADAVAKFGSLEMTVTHLPSGAESAVDSIEDLRGRSIQSVEIKVTTEGFYSLLALLRVTGHLPSLGVMKTNVDLVEVVRHWANTLDPFTPGWWGWLRTPQKVRYQLQTWNSITTRSRSDVQASRRTRRHDVTIALAGAVAGAVLTLVGDLVLRLF